MEFALVEIFIKAFILCGLLYWVARYEADYSFAKVAMVTAGISLGTIVIEACVVHKFGPAWTMVLQIAFIAFMLMTFCWISLGKSLLVVLLFTLVHIGMALAVAKAQEKMFGSAEPTFEIENPHEDDLRAITAEIEHNFALAAGDKERAEEIARQQRGEAEVSEPAAEPTTSSPDADTPRIVPVTTPAAPPSEEASDVESTWKTAYEQLSFSGFMSTPEGDVAVINGHVTGAREPIDLKFGGYHYRWRVKSVQGTEVILEQEFRVPLE